MNTATGLPSAIATDGSGSGTGAACSTRPAPYRGLTPTTPTTAAVAYLETLCAAFRYCSSSVHATEPPPELFPHETPPACAFRPAPARHPEAIEPRRRDAAVHRPVRRSHSRYARCPRQLHNCRRRQPTDPPPWLLKPPSGTARPLQAKRRSGQLHSHGDPVGRARPFPMNAILGALHDLGGDDSIDVMETDSGVNEIRLKPRWPRPAC
jgi:hypothetical protein